MWNSVKNLFTFNLFGKERTRNSSSQNVNTSLEEPDRPTKRLKSSGKEDMFPGPGPKAEMAVSQTKREEVWPPKLNIYEAPLQEEKEISNALEADIPTKPPSFTQKLKPSGKEDTFPGPTKPPSFSDKEKEDMWPPTYEFSKLNFNEAHLQEEKEDMFPGPGPKAVSQTEREEVWLSSSSDKKREDVWPPKLNLYEAHLQEEKAISNVLEAEEKRWSLHDEMSKLFNDTLESCFPDFKEDADLFPSYNKEHGDYNCQNVLTMWLKLRKSPQLRGAYPHITKPIDVGNTIKIKLQESPIDMIQGQPSVSDVGFVTFSLSPKWMAQSIQNMLNRGIDTWTPKLPVKSVLITLPSLPNYLQTSWLRALAIADTLHRMLICAKVDVTMDPAFRIVYPNDMLASPLEILKRWFSIEESSGGDWVIGVEDKPPFIIAKRDISNLRYDLEALRIGFEQIKADWIVSLAPLQQQEYIEMCFTAAKLEKWTLTDSKWKWIPDGTSYVGYRTCSTEAKELASLLDEVVDSCNDQVAQGEDARLLGYTSETIFDCVIWYTLLKTHRLANCTFTLGEMVGKEGETFVYLLNTRAKIHRIIDDSRDDIDELMKTSELEKSKGWGECEEHVLQVHLLEFSEAFKESCSYLSPHILCEYLYSLSKKFTDYYSSMHEEVYVALLLCKATAIVMDKCFHLLGLLPDKYRAYNLMALQYQELNSQKMIKNEQNAKSRQKMGENEQNAKLENELVDRWKTSWFVSVARDPPRNSRFELFSIRPYITTDPTFEKGKMFGFIAVSDKYGSISDGVSHLFEPDFAYVPLFNHEWCDPINMHNGEYIYLGNPSSRHSVAFSSSIEISMDIYVTTEKNAFELCSRKFKLDLSNIWGKNFGHECRSIEVKGADGFTEMYYMLIKDAVDAAVEIRYQTETVANETRGSKICGQIYAYYGSDILDDQPASMRPCYWALLFQSHVPFALEGDKIPLRKSVLSVPKDAPLIVSAYLYDIETEEVIMDDICELSSLTEGSSKGVIEGIDEETGCSLSLKVDWTYQGQYL